MSQPSPWSWGRYLRFVALAAALTAVLMLAGWWPAGRMGGAGARSALVAGCVISLLATIVGGWAAVVAGRRGSQTVVVAFAAMGLRLAVVVVLGLGAIWMAWVPTAGLLISMGLSYLALLALETRWVVRAAGAPPASRAGSAAPGRAERRMETEPAASASPAKVETREER